MTTVARAIQSEAEAGTENTKGVTPLRAHQAIKARPSVMYPSKAVVAADTVPSPVMVLRTGGHDTYGDGGHAVYKRAGALELCTYTSVNGPASGYLGASGDGSGMRDGIGETYASSWVTANASGGSLTAVLGSTKHVSHVVLRSFISLDGLFYWDLDGALLKYSTDGSSWTTSQTIHVADGQQGLDLVFKMPVDAAYVRVEKTTGWLAIAEFKVYTNAVSGVLNYNGAITSVDGAFWTLIPDADGINVKQFGAKGDGSTRDDLAFQAAADYLYPGGRGGIIRVPLGDYLFQAHVFSWGPIKWIGEGAGSRIIGSGSGGSSDRILRIATGIGNDNVLSINGTYPDEALVPLRTAIGAISKGIVTLTWNNITGLSVGDQVYVWLGISESDVSTPVWQGFQVITAITPGTGTTGSVTFETSVQENIADPTTVDTGGGSLGFPKPDTKAHKMWKPIHVAKDAEIRDLNFLRDTASGNVGYNACAILFAQNALVSGVRGRDTILALINCGYCENLIIERHTCESQPFDTDYPQGGSAIAFGGSKNIIIRGCNMRADGIICYHEGHSTNLLVENSVFYAESGAATFPIFIAVSGICERVTLRNNAFFSGNYRLVISGGNVSDELLDAPGNVDIDGLTFHGKGTIPLHGSIGPLRVENILTIPEPTKWRRSIALTNGMDTTIKLPYGFLSRIEGFFSDKTGVTGVALYGIADGVGTAEDLLAKLDTNGPEPILSGMTQLRVDRTASPTQLEAHSHSLVIATTTVTAGAFLFLEITYYPYGYNAADKDAWSPANIAAMG